MIDKNKIFSKLYSSYDGKNNNIFFSMDLPNIENFHVEMQRRQYDPILDKYRGKTKKLNVKTEDFNIDEKVFFSTIDEDVNNLTDYEYEISVYISEKLEHKNHTQEKTLIRGFLPNNTKKISKKFRDINYDPSGNNPIHLGDNEKIFKEVNFNNLKYEFHEKKHFVFEKQEQPQRMSFIHKKRKEKKDNLAGLQTQARVLNNTKRKEEVIVEFSEQKNINIEILTGFGGNLQYDKWQPLPPSLGSGLYFARIVENYTDKYFFIVKDEEL